VLFRSISGNNNDFKYKSKFCCNCGKILEFYEFLDQHCVTCKKENSKNISKPNVEEYNSKQHIKPLITTNSHTNNIFDGNEIIRCIVCDEIMQPSYDGNRRLFKCKCSEPDKTNFFSSKSYHCDICGKMITEKNPFKNYHVCKNKKSVSMTKTKSSYMDDMKT